MSLIIGLLRRIYRPPIRLLLGGLSQTHSKSLVVSQSQVELLEQEPPLDEIPTSTLSTCPTALSKEESDKEGLTDVLELFAAYSRSFTLREFTDWLDADIALDSIRQILLDDPRFICLGSHESQAEYYIPEAALFRWWSSFSLRLAHIQQSRLSQHQFALAINSLRLDGRWETPPDKAIDFGRHYGFIASSWTSEHYVFPLAYLLSFLPPVSTELASRILHAFGCIEKRTFALGQSLTEVAELGLSQFDQRIVRVVKAREGLSADGKMTLEQIGTIDGITRERVRQIEAKFWKCLLENPENISERLATKINHARTAFLTAFLAEFMRKHGSLIIKLESDDTPLVKFLAKCLVTPLVELQYGEFAILGVPEIDPSLLDQTNCLPEQTDPDAIASQLNSTNLLHLSANDLRCVAKVISSHKLNNLNKTEKIYLALNKIGGPAHYSKVAEVYNSLFPEDPMTQHNIHAVLSRCASPDYERHGIVWIGAKGTYALKELGYERPSMGLFDAVTEIVEEKYEETGENPVPFTVITAEIGKYRQAVNLTSLIFATHMNPRLKRVFKDHFVPRDPDAIEQDEITDDELDKILREFQEGLE